MLMLVLLPQLRLEMAVREELLDVLMLDDIELVDLLLLGDDGEMTIRRNLLRVLTAANVPSSLEKAENRMRGQGRMYA